MSHELHVKVAELFERKIRNKNGVILLKDQACQGKQQNSLFITKKDRKEIICKVDLLIIKDLKIRVIIEVDESNIIPTKICGKFLTSALSKRYIRNQVEYEMNEKVFFLQILSDMGLNSKKNSKA